jgi:hypothetical protein
MSIRVTDLALTPDYTRLIAVGMHHLPPPPATAEQRSQAGEVTPVGGNGASANAARHTENRILIYDLATRQEESYVRNPSQAEAC